MYIIDLILDIYLKKSPFRCFVKISKNNDIVVSKCCNYQDEDTKFNFEFPVYMRPEGLKLFVKLYYNSLNI